MLNKRPSTPARAAAARANGAKSRGPATHEGKAQSSGTRLRHGLRSRDPLAFAAFVGVDPKQVEIEIAALTAEYPPTSPSQIQLVRAAAELLALGYALQQRFDHILQRHTGGPQDKARDVTADRADLGFLTVFIRLEKTVSHRLEQVLTALFLNVGSPEHVENTAELPEITQAASREPTPTSNCRF